MKTLTEIVVAYAIIAFLIVAFARRSARSEPTSHGQDILYGMGCLFGIGWPIFAAYLVVASPWIAWEWWKTRDER